MGQLGSLCRRGAAEVAADSRKPPSAPLVTNAGQASTQPAAAFISGTEELRRRGVRPKMPKYNELPLLTIGKEVRILKETGFRRALIECVNETERTVDIAYEDGDKEDETVSVDIVRPLEEFDEEPEVIKRPASVEEKRQLGIRPNAPEYNDTPLLSLGKMVRVKKKEMCRRAVIECVDEKGGSVDIVYHTPAEAWPGASVIPSRKRKGDEEDNVPISAVKPLEEFEFRKENLWNKQFSNNFYGAVTALKEGADDLFIDVKDLDAALEYYCIAIDKLRDVKPSELGAVLLSQGGNYVVGQTNAVDVKTQKAFVAIDQPEADKKEVVNASLYQLIPVHTDNLALQGSIYLNRARLWMQIEKGFEAIQDLSVAIALWSACESTDKEAEEEARNDQMSKAYTLRAKIRLTRTEADFARQDISSALSFKAPEPTSALLWGLYRDMEKETKAKKFSPDFKNFASALPID